LRLSLCLARRRTSCPPPFALQAIMLAFLRGALVRWA
jgi:hypothetical protein